MNKLKNLSYTILAVVFIVFAASIGAAAAVVDYDASDEILVNEFVRLLKAKDLDGLAEFLSPAFIIQRADGTYLDKERYLDNPAHIEEYEITDVVATWYGDVRVIRYNLASIEMIDGVWITEDPAPRMSVFVWTGDQWQMIAHANFLAVSAGQ